MATKTRGKAASTKKQLIDKSYRLTQISPLTFELKSGVDGRLNIFDERKGLRRAIRHCPYEQSIFIDEQQSNPVVEPIIFINGIYNTGYQDQITQEFLDNHPDNGVKFELIDDEKDARDLADLEDMILDVKAAVRAKVKEKNGIEQLRIVLSAITSDLAGVSKMSVHELKMKAYELAESNVSRFVNDEGEVTMFDNADFMRHALAQEAFNAGVLTLSSDSTKILWADDKGTVANIPAGMKHTDFLAEFLATEQGIAVAREINERL